MNKKTEHEIISILDEQIALGNIEAFAGNEIKREFHRGAVFGIKLILDTIHSRKENKNEYKISKGFYEQVFTR